MTRSQEELRPCPCGAKQFIYALRGFWYCGCTNEKCSAERVPTKFYLLKRDAIIEWNSRSAPDKGLMDALEGDDE